MAERAPCPTSISTRQPGQLAVHHHEWHLPAELLDQAVAHPGAAQQHPVDLLGQRVDQLLLGGGVLVGVGHEDVVVAVSGLALRRFDQWREEGVGDVGDDQPDVVGTAGDEGARGPVRPVAQILGAREHPYPGLRIDQMGCREGAGDGGDVHAGGPCDVPDGDWHPGPFVDVSAVTVSPINANGCSSVNGGWLQLCFGGPRSMRI
ncbi:hypothetical protein GCM10029963_17120 [Micromonospora andamanensis]